MFRTVVGLCLLTWIGAVNAASIEPAAMDSRSPQPAPIAGDGAVPDPAPATPSPGALRSALDALGEGSMAERTAAASVLASRSDEGIDALLQALADGQLYRRRADGAVVFAERDGSRYQLTDPLTAAPLPPARRRDVRRVAVNNALRAHIEQLLARRQLTAPAAEDRLTAAQALIGTRNSRLLALLGEQRRTEADADVQRAMTTALNVARLLDSEQTTLSLAERISAADALAGNTNPAVRQALTTVADNNDLDQALRDAAQAAARATESRIKTLGMVETLFFGLSLGSVLVLAAIGLAITFGVMGVINMAHGELLMIGAYTAYVLQTLLPNALGTALLLAVPTAFVVAGAVGIAIERLVIRHLYGRPLETLLATFGISLILQQTVRSVFSPLNRTVATPEFMSGAVTLTDGLALTSTRLYILVFSLAVFALVLLLLNRSRLGLSIRAVAQNRSMARALGVRGQWVDAMTFGLGAGIAGIAGVALSQLTNVGPNMGQAYIIDSFLVVVFGGVGNLWGTLVGGLTIGVLNKVIEPFAGAVLAKITVLVMVILFIQRRPQGLFPQRGRAAEG